MHRKVVAIVPHMGDAKSHILRGIALYKSVSKHCPAYLILPRKSQPFISNHFPELACEWIEWPYGYNDALMPLLSEAVDNIIRTSKSLAKIIADKPADLILGVPGFHSSAICYALGLRHISVLHGPWLTPEYDLGPLNPDESAVLHAWNFATEVTDTLTAIVSKYLGGNYTRYKQWLDNQEVWVAQDFSPLTYKTGRRVIGFLYEGYGLEPSLEKSLYLTVALGSVLKGLSTSVYTHLAELDLPILTVGGEIPPMDSADHWYPTLPGDLAAKSSKLAIIHGGIGTIPIFAQHSTPQYFIPHDLDQAFNALLATRSGMGTTIDLSYWYNRTPFGRKDPPINSLRMVEDLRDVSRQVPVSFRIKINDDEAIERALMDALDPEPEKK